MKKFVIAALAAATLCAGPALANPLEVFFANTVETTTDGQTTIWHFNADNTLSATLPNGAKITGAWAQKGGDFCVTVGSNPESCSPFAGSKAVGDTWTATNTAGQTYTATIKAGR